MGRGATQGREAVSEQLAIPEVQVESKPKLTDRQALALAALQAADHAGLHADEVGALLHEQKQGRWGHSREERCAWCGGDGLAMLRRLRELGHARYRAKLKAWQATELPLEPEVVPEAWDGLGPVPYGVIPY